MLRSLRFLGSALMLFRVFLLSSAISEPAAFKTVRTSNAAILNRLGLVPLEIPDGHHKKRLAGPEPPSLGASSLSRLHQQQQQQQPYGRHHSAHRDSHVYIVKLPASPPYYSITKPHRDATKNDKSNNEVVRLSAPSLGFQGNGKPAKIYHWNLPIMKKLSEKKRLLARARLQERKAASSERWKKPLLGTREDAISSPRGKFRDDEKLLFRNKISFSSPEKHARNNDKRLSYPESVLPPKIAFGVSNNSVAEAQQKRQKQQAWHEVVSLSNEFHASRNTLEDQKPKKHRKKAATSYYAPIASAKSGSMNMHRSFAGNGKPKAFYVMEKSRDKSVYYHPLLP